MSPASRRGSVYDWIYPESQVPGGQIGLPPPLDPPGDTSPDGDGCKPTAARGELEEEPEAWGPPGTVPVLRTDPDRIYAPGTVADFLSKYGNASDIPMRPVDPQVNMAAGHFHAGTEMTVTSYGGEGYISVWQPWVVAPTEMSLAQMAVISVSSTGAVRETIEAGWHVYGTIYGDFAPHFFIYFTTNGYTQPGPNTGSYNQANPKCYDHIGKFDPNQQGKSQQLFGGPGQNQQCP